MPNQRILTGDRPTSRLHLGHYVGSLENRVKLQHDYETFVIIADVQALTTHFNHPEKLKQNMLDVAIDYLSVGLEPDKSTIFLQSLIPQIAELTVFYSMLITVNSLRHNPTIKTEAAQYGYGDLSYGFLGYPVSQAADITFCKANVVPVGEDQRPVVEVARKLVRRFNELYKPVLVEPEVLISRCPRLVGLDGNAKMSKSLDNAIYLSDSKEIILEKVKSAVTDPARIRLQDKGHPEVCTVFQYYQVFQTEEAGNVENLCREAGVGCTACKSNLANVLTNRFAPVREKRHELEKHSEFVWDVLEEGSAKARHVAKETLDEVKEAMGLKI